MVHLFVSGVFQGFKAKKSYSETDFGRHNIYLKFYDLSSILIYKLLFSRIKEKVFHCYIITNMLTLPHIMLPSPSLSVTIQGYPK